MTSKSRKFLIGVALVNTMLFAAADLAGIAFWWVLLAEVLAYVGYSMIKTWFHPAQQLVNQGSRMGWVYAGIARDENGWRDTLLRRNDILVRVSYPNKALYIVEPMPAGPYKDFLEVERLIDASGAFPLQPDHPTSRVWLALREIEANEEIPGLSIVRNGVEALLRDAERIRYTIDDNRLEPRTLAYLLIHNVAMEALTSGEHHIYRGTLGMTGTGLKACYVEANRKLVEMGYQNEDERKRSEAAVMREISEIG